MNLRAYRNGMARTLADALGHKITNFASNRDERGHGSAICIRCGLVAEIDYGKDVPQVFSGYALTSQCSGVRVVSLSPVASTPGVPFDRLPMPASGDAENAPPEQEAKIERTPEEQAEFEKGREAARAFVRNIEGK